MNVSKHTDENSPHWAFSKTKKKKCKRKGCNNLITAHKNKEYCSDPKCVAFRDMKAAETRDPAKYNVFPKTINVIVPKKRQLRGKVLQIQCSAKGRHGRCKSIIKVPYTLNRSRYPRFCEEHTNEYKRKRWENGSL